MKVKVSGINVAIAQKAVENSANIEMMDENEAIKFE